MEEKSATFELNLNDENETANSNNSSSNHGWQKVTYAKKTRKAASKASDSDKIRLNGTLAGGNKLNVFQSVEEHADERRRRALEAHMASMAATAVPPIRSKRRSDDGEGDDSDVEDARGVVQNGTEDAKKVKPKKVKKPKVTVADAAAKIDPVDLAAFLVDITASYELQQDIQLMRFADYFGRAFSGVSAAQFPWTKMFREFTVAKIADIPLSHISEAVYKTSVDWINQRSFEALGSFVLWSLDSIMGDIASHQAGVKVSKKGVQQASSKSQVAIFVVLAMVLRRKPDVLVGLLPTLRENSKYQGQDKLPVIVWMIAQACQGDLAVGLYSWAHNLLPIVSGRSSCNPQSRDLVLQLVERILSAPKARPILLNGAGRKGERLMPPFALEILMRITFPASSARVKATERFEAIYPTLKEVALAGSPGSKAMKQVSQQIFTFAVKAVGENVPELSKEATGIFIWCLTQNADCYRQWDKIYQDNLDASVAVLRKLSEEWKEQSVKQSSLDTLKETLKSFRHKNEKALASKEDFALHALFKDADKYCKVILGRLSRGHGCMRSVAFAVIAVAVGTAIMSSPNMGSWDWNKLSVMLTSH
ncbi:hypothetical protein L1049_006589 [Liquidambar formosana]|uniref:Transmembrane protein 214-A n=1 Tax=Liquidambar formosana TaxID=63359 RepID=A0AAP0RFS4_LIQFO